jgi:hypothetical protein
MEHVHFDGAIPPEQKIFLLMKIHNLFEMWQGNQNQRATQREIRAKNKKQTSMRYISNTQEIVKHPSHSFHMMV